MDSIKASYGQVVVVDNGGFFPESDPQQDAACVFCGEQLGRTRGWLRRRPPLLVGIKRGGQVMCEECLQLMKDIAAEWNDLEGFDDGAV